MAKDSLQALSMFRKPCSSSSIGPSLVFFSGIVGAEMRKNVNYSIKIILHQTGEIQNSHCECPAGAGPHGTCKHVVCACSVLAHFSAVGELTVALSCTDQLQTFKKPTRAHAGSPKRAEEIGKGVKKDDDPRPERFRASRRDMYRAEVYNATINFACHSGVDVSMRYAFPRADLQSAMVDHQYLEKPFGQF
jgi:hypothetical protein